MSHSAKKFEMAVTKDNQDADLPTKNMKQDSTAPSHEEPVGLSRSPQCIHMAVPKDKHDADLAASRLDLLLKNLKQKSTAPSHEAPIGLSRSPQHIHTVVPKDKHDADLAASRLDLLLKNLKQASTAPSHEESIGLSRSSQRIHGLASPTARSVSPQTAVPELSASTPISYSFDLEVFTMLTVILMMYFHEGMSVWHITNNLLARETHVVPWFLQGGVGAATLPTPLTIPTILVPLFIQGVIGTTTLARTLAIPTSLASHNQREERRMERNKMLRFIMELALKGKSEKEIKGLCLLNGYNTSKKFVKLYIQVLHRG
ncbi:hypothetical protein MMC07_000837 [Pseudocyphellaria aurata]|nr:hypothetical protein [Pseudocyphellaria aurata]